MKIFRQRGAGPAAIIATIAVLAVVGIIIAVISGSGDDNSTDSAGNNGICHTYCLGLVELECGSNKFMGGCLGVWDCSPPDKGAHECKSSNGY